MRAGFESAIADDPDHLLMYNDDTMLDDGALTRLVESADEIARRGDGPGIVTGTLRDESTGAVTYGGILQDQSLRTRMRFRSHVRPGTEPLPADTLNFNLALVSREAYRSVGNLDGSFTHCWADLDYGLRARKAGFPTWVAPGFHGTCSDNPEKGAWSAPGLSRAQRIAIVRSPKGMPPREFALFCRRWGGPAWPVLAAAPYVKLLVSPSS
jgi:GT2 family glycosyltransferase